MKNKVLTALFVCLFAALGLSAQTYYPRTLVTLDTITNTEADTIYIVTGSASPLVAANATVFNSDFTYSVIFGRTSISGTANTTVILQESNVPTGGANTWYTIATASGTGATVAVMQGDHVRGRRLRAIITGTASNVVSYSATLTLKKVN